MGNLKELQPGRWCGVFAGRAISVAKAAGSWLVYIDHVLQRQPGFETADKAYNWACSEISRMSTAPKPALARMAPRAHVQLLSSMRGNPLIRSEKEPEPAGRSSGLH